MEYLILLISIFIACLLMKFGFRLQLFKSKRQGALTLGSLFIIGVLLDSFALVRGYWSYEQRFFVGITIGFMPLEEYFFMLVIPLLTLVFYRLAGLSTRGI